MGKMTTITTQFSEDLMIGVDRLAKAMDRSYPDLVEYAIMRLVDEANAIDAFVQAGIDSAENEPLIPHEQMRAELDAMITAHRAQCTN